MATCKQCGNEFEAQRSTAQYCSAKCRVAAGRDGLSVTADGDLSVTDLSVTAPTVRLADLPQPTNALLSAAGFVGRWPTGERTARTAAMTDSSLASHLRQMHGDWWVTPEYAEVVFRQRLADASRRVSAVTNRS